MKPLKRPMFRNGGPIKEGIMHRMQDGGLANNEGPRRAALVGNPVYPKGPDGRTGHFIPAIIGGGMAALRAVPAIYRGFMASRAYAPMSQKLGIAGRFKDIFTPRGALSPQVGATGPVPRELLKGQTTGFKFGSLLRRNPLSLGLPVASLAAEGTVGALKMAPNLLKTYANQIIPFADPFDTSGAPKESKTKTKLERVDKITNVGEVDTKTTEPGAKKQISESEKTKLNEDRINATKEKYYKLMGVDKLNKDATYDSLIDASRIIQEEGGDLKGSIKSGTLQNRIIQAIGKNLDKSVDLKKAIDSAVLKGEIQKDINLTKPSAFQEQLAFIRNNPDDPLAKKLSGSSSVADVVAASVASGKGTTLTSDNIASIIESKGTDTAGVIPDDKYQKWSKANEGKDEIDFFIEKYSGLDDGLYIVNKKAFRKQGNQIAPVSLDSIIG
jgi:hypothetical protein